MAKSGIISLIYKVAASVCGLLLTASCANLGSPSGGARDETPPLFVSANPAPGAVNVKNTRVTINFDEIVNVRDAFSNVVVSPVSKSVPRVQASGKHIYVTFDSLAQNTTYTLDFADAIEDNNESNRLDGFAYTFSTGATIDSLRISGMVLDAYNLEPRQQILVGVTQNLADSAFTRLPLLRVAKTNDRGQFTIRGLAPGQYRVFALEDKDNDYKYANPEEDIAFYDLTVSPYTETVEVMDSVYNNKTGELDTVKNRVRTRFLPNDILLRTFNSNRRSQYLAKTERQDTTKLFVKLNTASASRPRLEAVGFPGLLDNAPVESRITNDSMIYWLPEPLTHVDSLRVAISYMRTDSAGNLAAKTDTIRFFYNRPKVKKKNQKPEKITPEDSIRALTMNIKAVTQSIHEVYDPLTLRFDTPLSSIDPAAFHLEVQRDTIWRKVADTPAIRQRDSISPRDYVIDYKWEYGAKYRLTADTLAAVGIYGKPTRPFKHEFTVKKRDEYCSLSVNLTGLDPDIPAFVDLLDASDKVVRTQIVRDNRVRFENLAPGRYFLRVTEDYDGDGVFDTGDYDTLTQPDLAYYYPKSINIKRNWDRSETWDVFATAIDQQKPLAIKKNRPAEDKRRRAAASKDDDEDEEEVFDPTANPFDPNDRSRRQSARGAGR